MFSHSQPRFGNLLSPNSGYSEEIIPPTWTSIGVCQPYDNQLRAIFTPLRCLSVALCGPFSRTRIAVDDIYDLERRLVILLAETTPTRDPDPNLGSDEQRPQLEYKRTAYQFSLAAMIYIYLFLRDNPVGVGIFSVLVSRLSNSLCTSKNMAELQIMPWEIDNDYTYVEFNQRDIRFWVLVLGALAAKGREERSLFLAELRIATNALEVRRFAEFVGKLKKVAWIDRGETGIVWQLWGEVYRVDEESLTEV